MTALVRRAARAGAQLVVTPEYGLALKKPAREPKVGERPASLGGRPGQDPMVMFSELARQVGIYLVVALKTVQLDGDTHNTQVAFGPDGAVVAKHHKIVLFAREKRWLERGEDVTVFDTPFGKVGLLICADLYGDPQMHDRLVSELGATIVAVSAQWTVRRAVNWQAAFAHDWGVHIVAANSSGGAGRGGGIFDPRGRALAIHESVEAGVAMATIAVP